jgi:hypothetical protein
MKQGIPQVFSAALVAGAMGFSLLAGGPAFAQDGGHLPHDWSHRHLLYPNPDTRDEAARKGTLAFEQWKQKMKDPRFAAQVDRKTHFLKARDGDTFSPKELEWAKRFDRNPPHAGSPLQRDWSVGLNSGADAAQGYGKPGVFPAKYGFVVGTAVTSANCATDFVVFPTTGKGVIATGNGSFSAAPTAGQTVTITNTNTGQTLILTASSTLNTGTNFLINGTNGTATNLAAAIVRNGTSVGVTETGATRPQVTVAALDPGAGGNNIALAKTLSNFTWGTATLTGGADPPTTRPTIVALNNLYDTTCPGTSNTTPPPPYWAFNTGAAFTETSPVLSFPGDQVAFTQRGGANGQASLVLLKGASSGTIAAPTALTSQASGAAYRSCTAPCMLVLPFKNSAGVNNASPYHTDTNSSPFYDYVNDVIYVGDDSGYLHQFTGVFNGTPAEAGSPWPVAVSASTTLNPTDGNNNELTSPVYDYTSQLIFVGSASGSTKGGSLHSINASGTVVTTSGLLATARSAGVRDAPIVDSNAGRVYAFVSSDAGASGTNCNTAPCAAVYQFTTGFTNGTTGTLGTSKFYVGRGVTSTTAGFLYAGTFDNTYYASATPASPSGNLYVCGNQANNAQRPTLWKIPLASNVMSNAVVGPTLTSNTSQCSPIAEVYNSPNDYIYASVTANGNASLTTGSCAGACIYLYNLTGLTWATNAKAVTGLAAPGGTSGIIIDNVSTATGASQVYYSTAGTGTGGNAVQASQAGLN